MKNRVNSRADPEKVDFSNLLLSGELNKTIPSLPVETNRIRVDIRIAPVAKPETRFHSAMGCKIASVRHEAQAARCPVCHALVAAGPSFKDHVYFCRRGAR